MAGIERKNFGSPDETRRRPDKTTIEIVNFEGASVARGTFQPGWRWSEQVKPIVGGDSCPALHFGMMVSGTLHVAHGDGCEVDLGPGDVYRVQPGHDGWVVGDEPVVTIEFESGTARALGS